MEDININNTLHKWMMDFAVLQRIAPKIAIEYADEKTLKIDKAMAILSHPDDNTEDAIVQSLCSFANAQFKSSPVIENHAEGKRLTAEIWRYLVHHYHNVIAAVNNESTSSPSARQGEGVPARAGERSTNTTIHTASENDIITACFGHPVPLPYYPLNNAVYWERRALPATMEYRLNSCRKYIFTNGKWTQHCYMTTYFDTAKFNGLLHEIDRKLRLYLKTKRNLKAKPEESWAEPFIDAVLQADKQAKLEAAKPKIHIDFSGLAQIRQDASITRDRLLTEEETDLDTTSPSTSKGEEVPVRAEEKSKEQRVIDGLYNHNEIDLPEQSVPNSLELGAWSLEKGMPCSELKAQSSNFSTQTPLPLDAIHWHILNLLLQGESVHSYISAQHLMPTIVADTINEALFDEIGDNAIECDGDTLTIVEDYVDDVRSVIEQFPQ